MSLTTRHELAVEKLLASFRAIPADAAVRLTKRSSNLFRPRAESTSAGLEVSELDGVISVDPAARTADVQGMCTYEDLVAATLPYGLMPFVVPQLRTITLGGAVTGLGIESTSFRNGLPHESVLEMDVLTGSGELITATPAGEHGRLFAAFPNSYGSLGYATRLKIALEPVPPYVELRHIAFDIENATHAIELICQSGQWEGGRVDALDGTAFSPDDVRLTLARFTDRPGPTSDYTGQQVYYRSIAERSEDRLTIGDYIWRWDTDWFWCSRAFGAQNRWARRIWPRRWRRSDVYHRLVRLDARLGLSRVLDKVQGIPGRERVIQDVEVPLNRLPDFLRWFDSEIRMRPVWICPLRTAKPWPTYPLEPDQIYVNLGFWGTVQVPADSAPGAVNRKIEAKVHELGGHKSLYSEAFYDAGTFAELYGVAELDRVRDRYDPAGRLNTLFDKAVRNS